MLDEIGDIYKEKLQNPQKAIAAYLEALELAADEPRQLLHKVLDLYTRDQAVEEGGRDHRCASPSSRPTRSSAAKYYYAAARITRDELKSLDDAVE